MCRSLFTAVGFALLIATKAVGVRADERIALTPEQRQTALRLITEHSTYHELPTSKRVLCELDAVQRRQDGGRGLTIVTTYHFEYRGGIAIRSVVDLTNGRVLEQTRLDAYSPPLAPEERAAALALA